MTGRRGGAASGWLRRRGPVSRAVLVVALMVGVGPRADPLGAAVSPSEHSVASRSVLNQAKPWYTHAWTTRVYACLVG
jgi:hypothetical protein